jgi:adenine-specific DNA glycosylase
MRDWLCQALPASAPFEIAEALIELGATLCKPTSPKCGECPLQSLCKAKRAGTVERVPVKRPSPPLQNVTHQALLLQAGGHLLLQRTPKRKAFGWLWRVPSFDTEEALLTFWRDVEGPLHNRSESSPGLQPVPSKDLDLRELLLEIPPGQPPCKSVQSAVTHAFVRTRCTLIPWAVRLSTMRGEEGLPPEVPEPYVWVPFAELPKRAFPSGHRSLIQTLLSHEASQTPSHQQHSSLTSSASQGVLSSGT